MPYATEPGFYDGKFVKRGGHYGGDTDDNPSEDDQVETGEPGSDSGDGSAAQTGQTDQNGGAKPVDPDDHTKDELIAIAAERGVDINESETKAEIAEAINAA